MPSTTNPRMADDEERSNEMLLPNTGPPPLTPAAFWEQAAAMVNALNESSTGAVRLRGIPVKRSGPGQAKVYGGFVYAAIRDPRTTDTIDARIPEQFVEELSWGREAVLVGLMRFKAARREIRLEFRLDSIEAVSGERLLAKDELIARWSQAIARPKPDVQAALLVPRPRVRVVTGVGSVAVDDIRAQLREAEADIDLVVSRVSMFRPKEVAAEVRRASDAHLLVLTRGGGQSVHDLDTDLLIEAVASSSVPVAVALGHASDDLVLNRVAALSFPTPTAFGAWLRTRIDGKLAHSRRLKEAEVIGSAEELHGLNEKLVWWRTAALLLTVVLGALAVWMVFGR